MKAINKVLQNPLPASEGGYGKPLGNKQGSDLAGFLKIKLKSAGIRVVYKLIRTETEMLVVVIGARADDEVYETAQHRAQKNIFENSDFIYMLNQAAGDRQILAKHLGISPHQLSYVTHSGEGEGLLFYGNTILPFIDHFPKETELYKVMTTKLSEISDNLVY